MIRNFVLAGGLLWTILLVTTVADDKCIGNYPTVGNNITSLVLKYGDSANATCRVPYPTESLGWEAPMGGKLENNAQELVWNVSSTDWLLGAGLECFANSVLHGQCTTKVNIIIYKIPESVSLHLLNHTGPLVEGKQYHLQCEVQSVAPAENLTIIWYREDTKLEQSNLTVTVDGDQTKDVNVTADLWITASRKEDGVSYSCEAKLDLNTTELIPGTRSIVPPLEVLYPPTIVNSTPSVSLTEGERLVLECKANGNPKPTYEWKRDDNVLKDATTSTLIIESTDTSNSGSYNCTAKNSQGEISTTIEVEVLTNYLPWIAIAVAIAIAILLAVLIGMYCSYHKKNKTGAYILTKFKFGASQNGQVAHANGYP